MHSACSKGIHVTFVLQPHVMFPTSRLFCAAKWDLERAPLGVPKKLSLGSRWRLHGV